jgi:hypothetical protein
MVRETLVEDEILDVQIDSLSPDEFVQAVCRKIGFPPPSIPLPQAWDDGANDNAGSSGSSGSSGPSGPSGPSGRPDAAPECIAAHAEAGDGRAEPEPGDDPSPPRPPQPDSS